MDEKIQALLKEARQHMEKAVDHVEVELTKIRAGRANPSMVDGVKVDYYGAMMPLNQVSNVSVPDARTILIQPWEKSMLDPIEKAIMDANLGFTPNSDGHQLRISLPPLTEERRKELVKKIKAEGENGRIAIRNIRKDSNEKIKRLKSEAVSEDMIKQGEDEVQKLTDQFIAAVDKHIASKEEDVMKV